MNKGITSEQKKKCLKIIDDIIKRPISTMFHEPVDPVLDDVPDYFDYIKTPSDLSTVRRRLVENKYSSLQEYKNEMNLIWENAITYNGKQSFAGFIAVDLSKYFNRKFAKIEEPQSDQWINNYLKVRYLYCKLFRTVPRTISPFPIHQNIYSEQNENEVSYSKEVDDDDLKFFEEAEELMKYPEVKAKVIQILKENEPNLNREDYDFKVNLAKISKRTLRLLRNYLSNI